MAGLVLVARAPGMAAVVAPQAPEVETREVATRDKVVELGMALLVTEQLAGLAATQTAAAVVLALIQGQAVSDSRTRVTREAAVVLEAI